MNEPRKPHDLALEKDLIATCLVRTESIQTVGVSEEDFALEANRLVWRHMLVLSEIGEPVDLVRIRSRLIDTDSLAAVGGEAFLATLRSVAPSKKLPIDRLHKMTRLRKLRAQAEAVAIAAAGNDADLAAAALDATQSMNADWPADRAPKSTRELANEWFASLGRNPDEGTVSPGLDALKRIVGRLDEGSMTLIGADVNAGKSSVALEMLFGAIKDGDSVGYLSFEDPEKIVTQRIISMLGEISPGAVRKYKQGDPGEKKIHKAMEVMTALGDKFMVSNCIGMNEREALEQMTQMARRGARLIVLDYIGVVGCSQKQQDRRNEIRWIATRFKARAAFLKVAIVVVSQFQRPKEGDSSRKPTKHSFRESGDLEAMAEYAIVMWRKVEDDFAPVYCELAKSKTGGVGLGWLMQREVEALDGPKGQGSGRLLEVFTYEVASKLSGNHRQVAADPTGQGRWDT
jgi:replicative DNA helicase